MEMRIKRIVHYSEERGSGIFACEPVNYTTELVRNKYRNVALMGDSRKLVEGETYNIEFEGANHDPQYGASYKIISVEQERLDTVESQNRFLKAILSPQQFQTLSDVYPNQKLVDLILQDGVDTDKTKGIKDKTLDKIKAKISKNNELSIIIAGTEGMSFTMSQIEKISKYYRDSQRALQMIQSNIYDLCKIETFGFLTVDKVAMARGDDPYNPNRIMSAIKFLIQKELDSGHTWMKRGNLLDKLEKLLELQTGTIIESVDSLSTNKFFYVEEGRITFNYVYEQEVGILEELTRISGTYATYENHNELNFKIKQIEVEQGFNFTDEQYQVLLEGYKHGVMIVNGKAGAGKTLLVSGIIKSLEIDNYITMALSGKASEVLASKGIKASTIHRAIVRAESMNKKAIEESPEDAVKSYFKYDLVVLDEASMIDVNLFYKTLKYIRSGTKLIIVGDSGQLPAIGYGDVLRDLLTTNMFPSFELTKVHRQAAKSGILSLANDIRDGKQIIQYNSSGTETYGELQDQTVISYTSESKDSIPNDILNIAKAYKSKIKTPTDLFDFQIIVANKDKRELSSAVLNEKLQEIFNPFLQESISHRKRKFKEWDKVIHKGNSYDIPLYGDVASYELGDSEINTTIYNGTMGIIEKVIKNSGVLVRFERQDGLVYIEKSELDNIQLAYALTIHSFQGSGVKHLVFAMDFSAYSLLSRQLVYTALTRAELKGVALVEGNALHKAISINTSDIRQTFLRDLIKEESQVLAK